MPKTGINDFEYFASKNLVYSSITFNLRNTNIVLVDMKLREQPATCSR